MCSGRSWLFILIFAVVSWAFVLPSLSAADDIDFIFPTEGNETFIRANRTFFAEFRASKNIYNVRFFAGSGSVFFQLEVRRYSSWKSKLYYVAEGHTRVELRFREDDQPNVDQGVYDIVVTKGVSKQEVGASPKSLVVDKTPPAEPEFLSLPDKTTSSANAIFEWEVEDDRPVSNPLLYSYSIDHGEGLPWENATSVTLSDIEDGIHNFAVRAKDSAGNIGDPHHYGWTVDTQPPTCRIEDPAGGQISGSIEVSVESEDALAGVEFVEVCISDICRDATKLDVYWEATIDTGSLDAGSYQLTARCRDDAGNTASHSIGVEVSNNVGVVGFEINGGDGFANYPELMITIKTPLPDNPPDWISFSCGRDYLPPSHQWVAFGPQQTYYFDLSDPQNYGCNDDDGPKTVWMHGKSSSGVMGESSSDSITLDRTPPTVTVEPPEGARIRSDKSITITAVDEVSGVDGSSLHYDAGSDVLKSFKSGVPFVPGWDEGVHSLYAEFSDNAGNPGSDMFEYTVDDSVGYYLSVSPQNRSTVGPNTSITVVTEVYEAGVVSLEYDNGDGARQAFVNATPFVPGWTSSGEKTLDIWIGMSTGKTEHRQYVYDVDASPPTFEFEQPLPESDINNDTWISVSISDASPISSAWFDNGNDTENFFDSSDLPFVSFLPGWTGEGVKTLTLWANDSFGNRNLTIVTYNLTKEEVEIPTKPEGEIEGEGEPPECLPTESIETSCDDGEDNDCDGLVDLNDPDCTPLVTDYDVSGGSIEVEQGHDKLVMQRVTNRGDRPLDVFIEVVRPQGVQVSPPPTSLHLGVNDNKSFNVSVHVPLSTEPKEYYVTFKFTGPPDKDSVVLVTVIGNELFSLEMPAVESSLKGYTMIIDDLEASGIDVSEARGLAEKASKELKEAEKSVREDDLRGLEEHLANAQAIVNQMPMSITLLQMLGFFYDNALYILAGILLVLFGVYFVSRLVLPYLYLRKKLAELQSQEKTLLQSRRSAEMQYFRRQIDEKTFRGLMVKEQEKLLFLRSQIKGIEKKTRGLFGLLISPSEFKGFFKELAKGFSSLRRGGTGLLHSHRPGFHFKMPGLHLPTHLPRHAQGRAQKQPPASERAELKKEIKSLEKRLDSVKGERREEAEGLLHMAHDYAAKGMDSMARYYVEKAKRVLG